MNTIIIDYDPFAMDSRIWLVRNNHQDYATAASTITELAGSTVEIAVEHDITDIKIHAPLAIFNEMKREIEFTQKTMYADSKTLNVEVI